MVVEVPDYRGVVLPVRTEYDLTDCTTLDCVAARDFLAIDDQEREWMEVRSSAYNHCDHVAHRRNVNLEAERLRDGLAIKQQLCAVWRSRPLRVQMFAVRSPLWRSGHIRRNLSINSKCITILMIGIADGQPVSEVVAVRTNGRPIGHASGGTRPPVEPEPSIHRPPLSF